MAVHPWIHLELGRVWHQDLLARAERDRITQAAGPAEATPAERRRQRGANASRLAAKPEIARHFEVEPGLEA